MRAACMVVMGAMVMTTAAFAEVTSGPQVGDKVGAFHVTKVGGNVEDGVEDGKHLCYRCRTGNKPVVMLFARSADEKLAKLVKKIEEELEEHKDDKMVGFVNMIGGDADSLKKAAADFVSKHGIKRVAFVVPDDTKDGPENMGIAADADLTVVCYREGTVKANHAFPKGGLTDDKIKAVVEASCKLVE